MTTLLEEARSLASLPEDGAGPTDLYWRELCDAYAQRLEIAVRALREADNPAIHCSTGR